MALAYKPIFVLVRVSRRVYGLSHLVGIGNVQTILNADAKPIGRRYTHFRCREFRLLFSIGASLEISRSLAIWPYQFWVKKDLDHDNPKRSLFLLKTEFC